MQRAPTIATRAGASGPKPSAVKLVLSAVIVAAVLLQALACVGRINPNYWPFLNYPMYRTARSASDTIVEYVVRATTEEGSEIHVTKEDLGVNHFKFRGGFIAALKAGDAGRAQVYAEIYRQRRGRSIRAFRLSTREIAWADGEVRAGSEAPAVLVKVAPREGWR